MYSMERLKELTYLVNKNPEKILVAVRGEYTIRHLEYEDIQKIAKIYGVELRATPTSGYKFVAKNP